MQRQLKIFDPLSSNCKQNEFGVTSVLSQELACVLNRLEYTLLLTDTFNILEKKEHRQTFYSLRTSSSAVVASLLEKISFKILVSKI